MGSVGRRLSLENPIPGRATGQLLLLGGSPLGSMAVHPQSTKSQQQSESWGGRSEILHGTYPGPPSPAHPFGTAQKPTCRDHQVVFGEQLCEGRPWTQARAVHLPVSRPLERGSAFGQRSQKGPLA